MSEPDYTSTYAKLERAEEHFELLQFEITQWHNACKHTFTIERGAYDTRVGLVIHMGGPDPKFLRWTLMVGDCINNARAALEHMVYAIGQYEAVKNPTGDHKWNQFVIVDVPTDFDGEAKRRLKCFTPAVLAAIEGIQPFNRPHPILPPLLGILRRFSNADKHRLLKLAASGVSTGNGVFVGTKGGGRKFFYVLPNEVEDNDIICFIESDQPDPNLNFQGIQVSLEVCLWHGLRDGETNPMYQRSPYSVLLPALLSEVKFVIQSVKAAVI